MVKNEEEIQGIKEACIAAKKVLQVCLDYANVGVTLSDIDRRADLYMRDLNVTSGSLGYHGFPKSICTSINNVVVHGIPNEYKLKDGDIVSIDIIVKKGEFYGDTCKTKMIGTKHYAYKEELIAHTKKCLELGIGVAKPGNKLCDIGNTINSYVSSLKEYDVVREFCGHGIGRSIHEPPQILNHYNNNKTKIIPGMVFTIEPIVVNKKNPKFFLDMDGFTIYNKKGILSAQEEHTILITDKGNEILT